MDFFNVFEIAIGVYLLYCAATGKGKYYENPYCKVPYEKYVKIMRILALIVGVFIMVSPILQLAGLIEPNSTVSWIFWWLSMAGIVGMFVANIRMTDREKAKAAQSGAAKQNASGPAHDPLRAAFVFDDEEETAPAPADTEADGEA